MGKAYKAPTFHVTAVTTRKRATKPIIFTLGVHTLDDHNIDTTVREAAMFELCERMQPGIIMDVNIPYCMTDWGGAIIQVKKRNKIEEGWQRNFWPRFSRLHRARGWSSPSAKIAIPTTWTTSCGVSPP